MTVGWWRERSMAGQKEEVGKAGPEERMGNRCWQPGVGKCSLGSAGPGDIPQGSGDSLVGSEEQK